MSGEVILRSSVEGDFPVLANISTKARERYRDLPGFAYVAETPPVSETRLHAGFALVATSSHKIRGFALIRPVDGYLFLDNISTEPDAKGIGAKLLRAVLAHAVSSNYRAITLTTFHAPPWNGPWFRKNGFELMPKDHIGIELKAIIDRQAAYLDLDARETLWHPLDTQKSQILLPTS